MDEAAARCLSRWAMESAKYKMVSLEIRKLQKCKDKWKRRNDNKCKVANKNFFHGKILFDSSKWYLLLSHQVRLPWRPGRCWPLLVRVDRILKAGEAGANIQTIQSVLVCGQSLRCGLCLPVFLWAPGALSQFYLFLLVDSSWWLIGPLVLDGW